MLNNITQAADKAFSRLDKTFGIDADVEIYETLKEEDFSKMVGEFGPDEVTKYIKAMEYRRLNNGKA